MVSWCYVGGSDYKITAIAVASRHRGKGGALAKEALTTCLGVLEAEAAERGAEEFAAYAWIDSRNWHSQLLFSSFGFQKGRAVDEYLSEWSRVLSVTSA